MSQTKYLEEKVYDGDMGNIGYIYTDKNGRRYVFGSEEQYKSFEAEAQAAYANAKDLRGLHGHHLYGAPISSYESFFDARYDVYGDSYKRVPEKVKPQEPTMNDGKSSTMTYEEWAKSRAGNTTAAAGAGSSAANGTPVTYGSRAEQVRQEAYDAADRERQRAIVDSSSNREMNRATYGQRAETLGAMGLGGSGYSDYMEQQAYATHRGEVQNANAQATYAKRIADQEYNATLEAEAEEAKSNYLAVLQGINDGSITTQNLALYADKLGISGDELAGLQQYAASYAQKIEREKAAAEAKEYTAEQQTKYSNFISSIPEGATAEQIKSLAKLWGITDEAMVQNATDYVTKYSDGYTLEEETPPTAMDLGYTTITSVNDAYHATTIDQATRDKNVADLNNFAKSQVQTYISDNDLVGASAKADELYAADALDEKTYHEIKADLATKNISGVENEEDYASVQKDLKQMLKKEQITESQYTALINKLDNKFIEIVLKDAKHLNMSSVNITQGTQIYNREVKIGEYSYTIVVGAISPNIHNALKTLKPTQTQIVDYNGKLYLYDKNKASWYSINEYNGTAASRGAPTGFYSAVQNIK